MTAIVISVGINLVLMGFFYIILSKRIAHRNTAPGILEQIRSELDEMVVELNRTADRNIGLMEGKMQTLNRLIGEADRRVSILRKETDKYTRNAGTYSNVRPIQLKLSGNSEPEVPEVPEVQKEQEAEKKSGETGQVDKRGKVIELYRQGISPEIIASRLESTVAEIELIISMTGADK